MIKADNNVPILGCGRGGWGAGLVGRFVDRAIKVGIVADPAVEHVAAPTTHHHSMASSVGAAVRPIAAVVAVEIIVALAGAQVIFSVAAEKRVVACRRLAVDYVIGIVGKNNLIGGACNVISLRFVAKCGRCRSVTNIS